MKKSFYEILVEKDDEFTYYVRSTVDIHNPEYFERVKMTLMPYRIKDISVDSFRPLTKDNKTFPDQPNHATYSIRVVTGLPVDTKKVLETMAMICHIHVSHLNMAPDDDVESLLPGKPIEVDKTTSQGLVGHQRLGEFMKELQRDRKDREKKFSTKEVYESFFTTHRALENVLKKPLRKGYYMVEMCRAPDGQDVMRAEGPFDARPDGNHYRDSVTLKSASVISESTTDGGRYGVQAMIELAPTLKTDEKVFEVAVSDMNSGRRYTAMVRANSPEIAREAAVTQVADAHRLDPSTLSAMHPRSANSSMSQVAEAEMPMMPAPVGPMLMKGFGFNVDQDFTRAMEDTPIELTQEFARPGHVIGYIAGRGDHPLGFMRRPKVRIHVQKRAIRMPDVAEAIENPNPHSGGQGHDPDHVNHPLHGAVTGRGYNYSHTTPIHRPDSTIYHHHTYQHGANPEHKVGVASHDHERWDTSTSPASGRQMRGSGAAALDKHLVGKQRRHGLR